MEQQQDNFVEGQEAPQQCQPEKIVPTPEQLAELNQQIRNVKQTMLNNINDIYAKFIEQCRLFPSNLFHQQQAFIRFDEGLYWMQNSIINSQLDLQVVQAPSEEPKAPSDAAQAPSNEPVAPVDPELPPAA